MPKLSIATKLLIFQLFISVATIAVFAGLQYRSIRNTSYNAAYTSAENLVQTIENVLLADPQMLTEERDELQPLIFRMGRQIPEIENITVVDRSLTVVADTNLQRNETTLEDAELAAVLQVGARHNSSINVGGQDYYRVYRPLRGDYDSDAQSSIRAAVMVDVNLNPINRQVNRTFLNTLAVVSVFILAASALLYLVLRWLFVRPLQKLQVAAEKLQQGDLSASVDIRTGDELEQLATAFNMMAVRLNNLVSDLQERITETQAARHEAERANEVKSAFLASVSHELRTPLNSILNFTKFVSRGVMGPVNERQTETLAKVVASGEHLLNLINDVLDMSKIESGSLTLFVEDNVDVSQIIHSVADTARSLLDTKPVTLQLELDPALPTIRADRKRLLQIILNVVSNACKFTEEGHIHIKAFSQADQLHLAISDTGPGIAPEDHQAVFESFKQTKTGLRQGEGTGLGMPISKSLAEAHGGDLWFESQVGKGTTFFIKLPTRSNLLTPVS